MLFQRLPQSLIGLRSSLGNSGTRRAAEEWFRPIRDAPPIAALHRAGAQTGGRIGEKNCHRQQASALIAARVVDTNHVSTVPFTAGMP